jgi:hypothetical protein
VYHQPSDVVCRVRSSSSCPATKHLQYGHVFYSSRIDTVSGNAASTISFRPSRALLTSLSLRQSSERSALHHLATDDNDDIENDDPETGVRGVFQTELNSRALEIFANMSLLFWTLQTDFVVEVCIIVALDLVARTSGPDSQLQQKIQSQREKQTFSKRETPHLPPPSRWICQGQKGIETLPLFFGKPARDAQVGLVGF